MTEKPDFTDKNRDQILDMLHDHHIAVFRAGWEITDALERQQENPDAENCQQLDKLEARSRELKEHVACIEAKLLS